MNTVTLTRTYEEPPFCEKEILRYTGCRNADNDITALLKECIKEVQDKLCYKVCYRVFSISVNEDVSDFEVFSVQSQKLADHLKNCRKVILFAATVGVEIDRLIAKYGRISPAKALMFQSIGAERIESLCDTFCQNIEKEMGLHTFSRFSPGYGDLSLSVQKDIFRILECSKHIGVSLNDSLLMSPSKSVTAFLGLADEKMVYKINKCSVCEKKDCTFRGVV